MINKTKRAYMQLLKKKRKKGWVNPLLHELEEADPKAKKKSRSKEKKQKNSPNSKQPANMKRRMAINEAKQDKEVTRKLY